MQKTNSPFTVGARILFTIAFTCLWLVNHAQDCTSSDNDTYVEKYFQWETIAKLPPSGGMKVQPGLAGAFAGIVNDKLIFAGGSNFPVAPPWEAGQKVWYDEIYVLGKTASGYNWIDAGTATLHKPLSNGVSVSTESGLLCIGGENKNGPSPDIFILSWNGNKITQSIVGQLPPDFAASGAFNVAGQLYVTGTAITENKLIRISLKDLLDGSSTPEWTFLEGSPGPPRLLPAYATQSDGQDPCLYLFGGRHVSNEGAEILSDGYYYNIRQGIWKRIAECPPVMAAAALPYGPSNILIFGGDDGQRLLERDSLQRLINQSSDPDIVAAAEQQLKDSFINHPGFRQEILSFNTITGTFQCAGIMPPTPPVVTPAFLWDGRVVIPSGEIKPGVRTAEVFASAITKQKADFQWLDYAVLIIYFALMLAIGVYFSARQNSTEDYFIGGGRVPWWAAGLSVFGTALSAITFMAIPAKTFATNWSYFLYNMSVLLATPIITMVFIPFYRKLKITSAYEYLERRFNVFVRLFGSFSFILFQIGRIAIVLYLPAIALSLVTGIDIFVCILVVGVLSTAYTLIGGIEAVIWTDVVQVIILMGGALLSLAFMFFRVGDDLGNLATNAMEGGKLTLAHLNFALNEPTIWVVLIGGFFINLVTYSSDQSLVQRYLTTPDLKSASKTAWTNAILVVPSTLIFFGAGTALFIYYSKFPERLDPFMENNDSIFPWFITNELPAGISGLLIAGIFSAAMSSLSSSMNSISTAFTTDFFKRFRKNTTIRGDLSVARIATLVSGVLGILAAVWMATSDILSLWDKFFEVLGLFTGGLGGVFLLGMLFKRANGSGAIVGLVVSSVVQYLVSQHLDLHSLLYVSTGVITCVVVGYLASLVMPSATNTEARKHTFHNIDIK